MIGEILGRVGPGLQTLRLPADLATILSLPHDAALDLFGHFPDLQKFHLCHHLKDPYRKGYLHNTIQRADGYISNASDRFFTWEFGHVVGFERIRTNSDGTLSVTPSFSDIWEP